MNPSRFRGGNSWYYSLNPGQLCQMIECQRLWGQTTCRVWLPGRDSVVRIPASRLKSLESAGAGSPDDIAYVAAAARVADALKAHAYPEMVSLLVIRVEGGGYE